MKELDELTETIIAALKITNTSTEIASDNERLLIENIELKERITVLDPLARNGITNRLW